MPVITLTTDFGLNDPYVGMMKGVIHSIYPGADIVDITNSIGFANIRQASFISFIACRYFPIGTIHVIVVDPGVGSERLPLAVKTSNAFYIAPDNGCLSMILNDLKSADIRAIVNREFMLDSISNTFHGRDIFAPAAAHLAEGKNFQDIGQIVKNVVLLEDLIPSMEDDSVNARVMHIDIFGNVITNIPSDFGSGMFLVKRSFRINEHEAVSVKTFSDVHDNSIGIVPGSSGFIEFAADRNSAAKIMDLKIGDSISVRL